MSSGEVPQPENIKGMFCLFLSGHHMKGREIKGDKTVFEKENLPKGWVKTNLDNVCVKNYFRTITTFLLAHTIH